MSAVSARLLYWSPRILTIGFAIFISLFALDVFSEFHGFWRILAALAIHLIPALIIVVVLVAAWRWDWIGALAFAGLAVYYGVHMLSRHLSYWPAVVSISVPLLVIATLFLVSWVERPKLHAAL